jgi:hypothetical protein
MLSGKPVVVIVICTAQGLSVMPGGGVQLGYTDEPKRAENIDRAANRALSLKQLYEPAWRVLCECVALATLRFRHLGKHLVKPGDFRDISMSRILHFV